MKRKILLNSTLIWFTIFENAHAQSGTVANPTERVPAAVTEVEQALDARKFIKDGLIPTEKADGCELHIWPTAQISSNSSGGLAYVGGILPALIDSATHSKQDSRFYAALSKSFEPNLQIDSLEIPTIRRSANIGEGSTVIVHNNKEYITNFSYNNSRIYKSNSACYYALIINKIAWKSTTQSKNFETTFEFRVFSKFQNVLWNFKKTEKSLPFCFYPEIPKDATLNFLSICFSDSFKSDFFLFAEHMRSKEPAQIVRGR